MLDIGADTGALVVYTSDLLTGAEIEIRPSGGVWADHHTAVRARHVGDRVLHAGVFGSLPAGPYQLRLRPPGSAGHAHLGRRTHRPCSTGAGPAVTTVVVAPGAVTETSLIPTPEGP